jgi:hypothetical protein
MVMVNLPTAGVDFHVLLGGSKGSFLRSARTGPSGAANRVTDHA